MTENRIETLIYDRKFEFLPSFYNKELAVTVPLLPPCEEGKVREVEEWELAVEKIRAVFSVLFPKGKPDALVSESVRYTIACGGDGGESSDDDEAAIEALGEMLETPIVNAMVKMQYELKYSRPFKSVSYSLPSGDSEASFSRSVKVSRERTVSSVGDAECDIEFLLRWQVAGICPRSVGIVSFDYDCALTVEDDRLCHVVFAHREAKERGMASLGNEV